MFNNLRKYVDVDVRNDGSYRVVTPERIEHLKDVKRGVILSKIPFSNNRLEKLIRGLKNGRLDVEDLKELKEDYFTNNFEIDETKFDWEESRLAELVLLSHNCGIYYPEWRKNIKPFTFVMNYSTGNHNLIHAENSEGMIILAKHCEGADIYVPNSESPMVDARKTSNSVIGIDNSNNPWINIKGARNLRVSAYNSKNPYIIADKTEDSMIEITGSKNPTIYDPSGTSKRTHLKFR